jgi:hypothetical protein
MLCGELGMAIKLDYETPKPGKSTGNKLARAAYVAFFEHILLFLLASSMAVREEEFRVCVAVSIGFWSAVLLIAIRRINYPTKLDLAFVALGFPVLAFIGILLSLILT